MKEASYYEKLEDRAVRCRLCPHECVIADGKRGSCGVRVNRAGTLSAENYGRTTGISLDPIEKKPLYHFYPGTRILSLGTTGCNLRCAFCQNWSISQDRSVPTREITPREVVAKARAANSFGIAYTYNEPFVWYEFVLETARLARAEKLANVLVTNGYVNPKPLDEMLPLIDAMNVDLKAFDDGFYRKVCKGRLGPVLETIRRAARSCHLELTTLLVPTLNDGEEELRRLVAWIADNVGREVPLHLSRYFPCYKMDLPPTPIESLARAERIAKERLKYVYLGNI